jgi:hypothetical protein
MFAAALGIGRLIVSGAYAAPSMFLNLGFPLWFVAPVFTPMYLIGTLDLVYMATGRSG